VSQIFKKPFPIRVWNLKINDRKISTISRLIFHKLIFVQYKYKMKLTFAPHTLYFKRPFKIAHGTRSSTPVVLTQLEHNGIIGYGEASMPPYLSETHETVLSFLNKAAMTLSKINYPFDVETILKEVDSIASNNTAAKA